MVRRPTVFRRATNSGTTTENTEYTEFRKDTRPVRDEDGQTEQDGDKTLFVREKGVFTVQIQLVPAGITRLCALCALCGFW